MTASKLIHKMEDVREILTVAKFDSEFLDRHFTADEYETLILNLEKSKRSIDWLLEHTKACQHIDATRGWL